LSLKNKLVDLLLSGFGNWDTKHFLHISHHNYIYEHSAAFFPLFPSLINICKRLFIDDLFNDDLVEYNAYLLSGVLLNFVIFNLSTIYSYKLTLILFDSNQKLAFFFCINPANIFFSSVYSEAFMLVPLSALYIIYIIEKS
jgi:hypothetical protein